MNQMITAIAAWFLATGAAFAAQQQASIEVSELYCPSCPYIAANAVKSIESVEIIDGDYDEEAEKIVFLVSYDDAITTPEAIAEAPMQYGYPGRVLDAAASDS